MPYLEERLFYDLLALHIETLVEEIDTLVDRPKNELCFVLGEHFEANKNIFVS